VIVQVQGGTRAGWRIVRQKPQTWIHVCGEAPTAGGVELPGYRGHCEHCGARRPT
jgi:hypothetical protein